jgi:hypothetical protein
MLWQLARPASWSFDPGFATCRLILEIEIRRRAAPANFIGSGMLDDVDGLVCTENLIPVDDVMKSPKLAE